MRRNIAFLVLIIIITGCIESSPKSGHEIIAHNKAVNANNEIDSQLFINDYIGIQMKLPKEYETYKYEDLNASTMPADKNIILYATMSNTEIIYIVESLYDGSDYRNETIEGLEQKYLDSKTKIEYQESDAVIGGKVAYSLRVIEEFDENRKMYIDYYVIEQKESLISIVLTYDEKTDISILDKLIDGIEFH
jgi:hypothetical protein